MHTDFTLSIFEEVTTALGNQLRLFSAACTQYATSELPREERARKRREIKKSTLSVAGPPGGTQPSCGANASLRLDAQTAPGRRKKQYNMHTYKHHALGDYVDMIRMYGTCDSYNTELVRMEVFGMCSVLLCTSFRESWNTVLQRHAIHGRTAGNMSSRWPRLSVGRLEFDVYVNKVLGRQRSSMRRLQSIQTCTIP